MVYNNNYPFNYGYMQQNQTQQQNNGIIWVQGEAGAKSYLVAPNTTVQLWDSEAQTIYIKSADNSGMPSIKVLDYTIRENNTNNIKLNDDIYVKKEELEDIKEQIMRLNAIISQTDEKESK